MKKSNKFDKNRLKFSSEKVRELRPTTDKDLAQVQGGKCPTTSDCTNGSFPG